MHIELTWMPSASASCFHATAAILAGKPLADAPLGAALAGPAANLLAALGDIDLNRKTFRDVLAPLAASIPNNRELATVAVSKAMGRLTAEAHATKLAGLFTALEAAFVGMYPNIAEDLDLRMSPIREQWEARGPGLMHALAQATDSGLVPEAASVILVHPALGGAGTTHLASNSAILEAVLVNPHADLPEVVRLGWLLATLQQDLPRFGEHIPNGQLPLAAMLATLPAALAAGQQVELTTFNEASVRRALECWLPGEASPDLAPSIMDWWATYVESRPPWRVALAAMAKIGVAAAGQS